jgi:hypothetical protein
MARREQIVMAYVLATGGRIPTDLDELLAAMRERLPGVTEGEVAGGNQADAAGGAATGSGARRLAARQNRR